MREFVSLNPEKLPRNFDATIHGEEPIVRIEETPGKITISYIFPGFYLVDDSRDIDNEEIGFKLITIEAVGSLGVSGRPQLPSFGRYVQIPQDTSYELTIEKSKPVFFDNVIVSPYQQMQTDSPAEEAAFEYDREFYSKDLLYPEEIVEVSGPFNLDQYNALLVHVTPFQYNPAQKKLIGYGSVIVSLEIKRSRKARSESAIKPSTASSEMGAFGNLLLNPGSRIGARLNLPEMAPASDISMDEIIGPQIRLLPQFLIIYAKELEAAAKKLARWKTRRGLTTKIASIDSIGNDVAKIKKYVRKEKTNNPDLNYVLLFGDTDTIATETIHGGAFAEYGDNITDYYYSTKADPPHQITSLVFPWLSIGRIPVSKDKDAMSVVDQIISYETEPSSDPEYYKRMAFAAYFQDDDMDGRDDREFLKTMEDIRTSIEPLGYSIKRIYVTSNKNMEFHLDGTSIPDEVKQAVVDPRLATKMLIDAVNEGQLFIGHRDHGNWDGWSHPSFKINDLSKVIEKTTSIFYSINCLTGKFDVNPRESFAEKNLRMEGAAPSLIAASQVSSSSLNNDLEKALFDATFGGVIPTFTGGTASYPLTFNRLGDVLNYSKSYLPISLSGSPMYIKDHFEIYHVIGDPTIELWTQAPRSISLKAKITTSFKRKVLHIALSECPKGCTITIWADDRMIRRLEPSSSRMAIFIDDIKSSLGENPVEYLQVCFHAPGCRYSEVVVKLGS